MDIVRRTLLPLAAMMLWLLPLVASCDRSGERTVPDGPGVLEGDAARAVAEARRIIDQARFQPDPEQFARAEELLNGALAIEQRSDVIYTTLGDLHIERHSVQSFRGRRRPPESARRMYEKAVELNPKCVGAWRGLSKYYEYNKEHRRSLEMDRKVLELAPGNYRIRIHTGRCYLNLEEYEKAEEVLLAQLDRMKKAPHDQTALVTVQELLGRAYMEQGKYDLAEQILQKSADTVDKSQRHLAACPYIAMGVLYQKTGQNRKAAENLMKAADLEDFRPIIQFHAAFECFWIGDAPNALKYINRAISLHERPSYKLLKMMILIFTSHREEGLLRLAGAPSGEPDPDAARGEFARALASYDDHAFDDAMRYVDRALAMDAQARYLVLKGYVLLMEKRYADAKALFDGALAIHEGEVGALVGLGHLGIIRKDYVRAREHLEPVLGDLKARVDAAGRRGDVTGTYEWLTFEMAHLGMGWLTSNQARHRESVAYYERVLERQPDDVFALLGKGNSETALNHLDEAEALFNRVLELQPGNKYALAELALVKYNKGEDTLAEKTFKKALQQDEGTYTCPYEGLGMVYLRQGRIKDAKESFRSAIDINPDIEYKKFNGLASIYIKERNYTKAAALLRKSIENYPYDPEASELLESIRDKL